LKLLDFFYRKACESRNLLHRKAVIEHIEGDCDRFTLRPSGFTSGFTHALNRCDVFHLLGLLKSGEFDLELLFWAMRE
jgi:hypothetical protein